MTNRRFKRKAFLFGISNYGIDSLRLDAATGEMKQWAMVLRDRFDFQVLDTPQNEQATRDAVLDGYKTLLAGAKPDDHLFFVAVCHGTIRPIRGSRTGETEHALVAYPKNGNLTAATIGVTDLEAIRVPRGTDLTFILETCFAGDAEVEEDPDAVPLFISSKRLFGEDFTIDRRRVRTFGSMTLMGDDVAGAGRDEHRAGVEQPLIVAASGAFEGAYQTTIRGTKRMLFSYRALPPLDKDEPDEDRPTFFRWIEDIKPLRERFPQVPILTGNEGRQRERFPGMPATELSAKTEHLPHPPHGPTKHPSQSETLTIAGGDSLVVDISGICCFVDVYPNRKRLVLPYDSMGHGHIAFLEIAVEDIAHIKGPGPTVRNYRHFEFVANPAADPPVEILPGGIAYHRWNLAGHKVTFSSIDTSQDLTVTQAWERHVPQMKKVLPDLDNYPRAECFLEAPPASLIAAYVDIADGVLDVAALEERRLVFDPPRDWPPERPPASVCLQLPLTAPTTTITITNTGTGANEHEITLKPTATSIRIGNLMIEDITGPGSGLLATPEHFLLYYKLSGKELQVQPIPARTGVPINSCSVTEWP